MSRIAFGAFAVVVVAGGLLAYLHDWRAVDLDERGAAATISSLRHGRATVIYGEAAEPDAADEVADGARGAALKEGDTLKLPARIDVEAPGELRIETAGGWTLLVREGRYFLRDARKDEDDKTRWIKVHVARGSFRAKPHDYHQDRQLLDVTTPRAEVRVVEGQIGMRVLPEGHGQTWLTEGEAYLEREDSGEIRLEPKKVEEI